LRKPRANKPTVDGQRDGGATWRGDRGPIIKNIR
jgi:hypothetical protein